MPHRQSMSSPNLSRNTPWLDFFQPLTENPYKSLWIHTNMFFIQMIQKFISPMLHIHKPLFGQKWLYFGSGSRTIRDSMSICFYFLQIPNIFQILNHILTKFSDTFIHKKMTRLLSKYLISIECKHIQR